MTKHKIRRQLGQAALAQVRQFSVFVREQVQHWASVAYYIPWTYKSEVREWLRRGALALVSISTLVLGVEVVAEGMGADAMNAAIEDAWAALPAWGGVLTAWLFLTAAAVLAWYHYDEARRPSYEYLFAECLCDLLEAPGTADVRVRTLPEWLERFHGVFRRGGLKHVSLYRHDGQRLVIQPAWVFPEEKDPTYFVPLNPGEGVAGRVFDDQNPRYVPRLYLPFRAAWKVLPSFLFPHAVRFRLQWSEEKGVFELGDEAIDFFVFKPSGGHRSRFDSFLSVPVRRKASEPCWGVLNFDFGRPDPLHKGHIAMAVVLGVILGQLVAQAGGEA